MIRHLPLALIASCLLSAALSGCASLERLVSGARSVESENTDVFTPVAPCLALRLHVGQVQQIDLVPLTLEARNTCGETIRLTLGGRPAYDFRVLRDGQLVWNLRSGPILTVVDTQEVRPGEDVAFTFPWGLHTNGGGAPSPLPSGQYVVQGRLYASTGTDEVVVPLDTPAQPLVVR